MIRSFSGDLPRGAEEVTGGLSHRLYGPLEEENTRR